MVIAGQLGGAIRTGRVLFTHRPAGPDGAFLPCDEASRTPKTPYPPRCIWAPQRPDLYLGLLHSFGVHLDRFGETGKRPIDLG